MLRRLVATLAVIAGLSGLTLTAAQPVLADTTDNAVDAVCQPRWPSLAVNQYGANATYQIYCTQDRWVTTYVTVWSAAGAPLASGSGPTLIKADGYWHTVTGNSGRPPGWPPVSYGTLYVYEGSPPAEQLLYAYQPAQ